MNINGKWDGATTLKFVTLYRQHPCLWDMKSVHYKNQQRRMQAYTAIATGMNLQGFGVPDVKVKIKNLRSTFSQELKKMRQNSYYESNLKWFKAMEDIWDMVIRRQRLDNGSSNGVQDGESALRPESEEEELETEMLEEEIFLEEAPATPPKKKTKMSLRNPSEFLKITHIDPLNSSALESDSSSNDIFGRSVAAQLKNLSPKNALLAKSQIQNILTDYGIKDLDEKEPHVDDNVDRKWGDGDMGENNFIN